MKIYVYVLLFLEINYFKNEIIRKQKYFNGKIKYKMIDRNFEKFIIYIL